MNLAEADAWYERNKDKLVQGPDPVSDMIERVGIKPKRVLEIGCANGWRLDRLCKEYGCEATGVDASVKAIEDGRDKLPRVRYLFQCFFPQEADNFLRRYDLIICGFFLYLADRKFLFDIAATIDRHLEDGGWLIIHDFYTRYPQSVSYKHDNSLLCYKMDYSRLFTGNPAYREVGYSRIDDDGVRVILLRKEVGRAWPRVD